MRIAIDIRHLTHPELSGVGLATLNVLRALPRLAPEDHFVLFASGTAATLARLPHILPSIDARNMTLVTKIIPNRLLFALLKAPTGTTLESLFPMPVDGWWFPDSNIIRTRLPYALTVHDLSADIFPHFFTHKDRLRNRIAGLRTLACGARVVLAVSQSTAIDLTSRWGVPANHIVVTPLGVGAQYTPRVAPSDRNYRLGYGLTAPYLLSLATREPRKNLATVIEAYDAFRARSPQRLRLVIAGGKGWKRRSIMDAHAKAAYRSDITFLGYVHEKHKPALYRGALALLFPSFYEGFGLPALEAMACGTPVVTSVTSALPEVVGDAGILVDPFNVTDTEQALDQLLSSPDADTLRAALAARGIEQAKKFSWDKTAEAVLKGLQRVCFKNSRP